MIPKIIHYCWYGYATKPSYVIESMATWQRHMPHYEFKEWNETNTNFEHPFLKQALQEKRWAFISDFVRIEKLREYGGVYLDTDMFFIKPIPELFLEQNAFIGAENRHSLSAGIIGTMPQSDFINPIFEYYNKLTEQVQFENELIPGVLNKVAQCVTRPISSTQFTEDVLILEPEVFYPLPLKLKKFHWNKFVTPNTIAIHLWAGSWLANKGKTLSEIAIEKIKYQISKWYVPSSFIEYARKY